MTKAGRRRGARRGRSATVDQRPWRQVENPFPPVEVLDEEGLARIEDAALTVLEEIGMDFLHPEAKVLLRQAGADVDPDSDRVRIDRHLISESVAKAPSSYTLHARNPEHNLQMGGRWLTFGAVSSPPRQQGGF